jgi:hypothetical protein
VTDAWGIVVAGGRGDRFGGPKQLELLGGEPLWEWARRSLIEGGVSNVVVVGAMDGAVDPGERRRDSVAAGLAEKCEVQVAYAIGIAEPVSVHVETFGTAKVDEARIESLIREHFDLRPKGIIRMLDLLRPIYRKTAANGHFGRDEPEFTWELTDKGEALRSDAGC